MLLRYQKKGDSGLRVSRARAVMMDVLMDSLYEDAEHIYQEQYGTPPCKLAILATGGYGRSELSPFSDIDLMFLFPNRVSADRIGPFQTVMTEEILYILWDLRLKVGHSVRNTREAIEEAKNEIKSKNAFLDSRLISGDAKLFKRFEREYRKWVLKDEPEEYVRNRLAAIAKRHAKYGNTPFLQEPEIKNGVGGLRDYHNILWLAQIKLSANDIEALEKRGYLRVEERKNLISSYDFLLRVRNQLHFQSKRPTDLLNLENQPLVAFRLGYRQRNILKRVEVFMQDYYQHANTIYRTSERILRRMRMNLLPGRERISFRSVIESRQGGSNKELDGLILRDGRFYSTQSNIFEDDPERLIRVFRHAQQFNVEFSLELADLIEASGNLITPAVINSSTANRSFRAIMQTPGNVFPFLSQMHELGILGKFVPEFGQLTYRVQHEHYHRYTADIHILGTIRELDRVNRIDLPEMAKYREALRETPTPNLLYLMLLLHDIGKIEGVKDHHQTGLSIAKPMLNRLQIIPEMQEQILFIIEHHLEMARFWQRHDIDDSKTAALFARQVEDTDNLKYLYVATYCDARATSENLWNGYKDALHTRLYHTTLSVLTPRGGRGPKTIDHKMGILEEIKARAIEGVGQEEIEAHFSLLPERYFIHHTADDVELHLRMVHELLTNIYEADSLGSLVPVVDWKDDLDQSLTVVNVVTWDRPGLFFKLAGAFSVAGINILSTKAISRSDHITIDTFYVAEPSGGVVTSQKARGLFEHYVKEALLHNRDLLPEIHGQSRRFRLNKASDLEKMQAPFPPQVDIYHEISLKRTIVEIQGIDRIGLLYELARAIFDSGFDITFARIATERGIAMDTFYIESIQKDKSKQEKTRTRNLVELRELLNRIIRESGPDDTRAAG